MPDGASVESLLDILELIERIERQTGNLSEAEFLADADVEDGTAYRLLAIGEVAKISTTVSSRGTRKFPGARSSACGTFSPISISFGKVPSSGRP
jgi:hypothetical protein